MDLADLGTIKITFESGVAAKTTCGTLVQTVSERAIGDKEKKVGTVISEPQLTRRCWIRLSRELQRRPLVEANDSGEDAGPATVSQYRDWAPFNDTPKLTVVFVVSHHGRMGAHASIARAELLRTLASSRARRSKRMTTRSQRLRTSRRTARARAS